MTNAPLTVAIDLGGTHIRSAAVAADGTIVTRHRQPTPTIDDHPTVVPDMILQTVSELSETYAVDRAVVGLPGIVDHGAEQLKTAPNLPPQWVGFLSEDWIASQVGLPVSLANDADLAAVGEAKFGAGAEFHDVVYVTVSTGVGAGVVVDGTLVRGRLSGGEIGHTVIDWSDAASGVRATVEELGSGTAIDRQASIAGLAERGAELADLVRAGDEKAASVWNRAITAVGIGIANLAWLVAPQIVVVGGGVGRNFDLVEPVLRSQLEMHGPAAGGPINLAVAALGDDAALAGAAAWWTAVGRK